MGILLIGCGQWGNAWAATLAHMGELAAICDRDPQRLAKLQTRYPNVACFDNLSQALLSSGAEAAIIATPTQTHNDIAHQCLAQNKPVLVESLLTPSADDAERLVHHANKRALCLAVGYPLLFHRAVQTLYQMIHNDVLGPISTLRIYQHAHSEDRPVGHVWEQWGHTNIALLRFLLNEPVETTGAICSGHHTSMDPTATYFTAFKSWSGRHASIEVNGRAASRTHEIVVTGASKIAVLDFHQPAEKALMILEGQQRQEVPVLNHLPVEARIADNLLEVQTHAFLAAIRHGSPLVNPGKLGAQVVTHINDIEAMLTLPRKEASSTKTATPLPLQQRQVRHLPRGIL